ncbi:hypothetical protein FLL45_03740 [Aliikangiella marina]|uniref:Tetratricopeptide repeat protein n=1 Tax=Aliikangiella marina TaxID=1712262 RepID=A0A545TIS3_9GAMM|nr:hypothetical protein [Aliikangiella marina]TQV77076.1 hypothetical protein FLL45_03740 [Aliikangiella marina]
MSSLGFTLSRLQKAFTIGCLGLVLALSSDATHAAEQSVSVQDVQQTDQDKPAEIEAPADNNEQTVALSEEEIEEAKERAEQAKEDLKKPVKLEDLAYGGILFDYYRGETIDALNGILVAQKRDLLPNHSQSARLLSGVIYLDLGMLSHAQEIFNDLLTEEELQSGLLSRIEFYLGKLHYRQSDFAKAEFRLSRILNALDSDLKDDALIMLSNIAIYADKKEQARAWLQQISTDSKLSAISQYNLGILWLREQKVQQAAPLLTTIHPEFTEDKVVKSLQDKAHVALGYYHLSQKEFEKAREYLFKVRLESPQANKAMLGVGWSYGEDGNYNRALSHWTELAKGDIRDVAVQEAYLAVPFAYQRLNSMQLSLEKYVDASNVFQNQIELIDDLMTQIQEGDLLERFVNNIVTNQFASIADESGIQDSKLFGDKYDYYLYELVSQHQFNEGFRSYQKLGKLAQILDRWEEALPTFSDILTTNELRFAERIPVIDQYLAEGAFEKFQSQLAVFDEDIKALKNNEKMHLIATKEQLKLHKRISGLFEKLERIPEDMLSPGQVVMAKRARGILQWQMEEGKVAKIWQLEKIARDIRRVLSEMEARKISLANARQKAQTRFMGYQEQVDGATGQLVGLREKIKEQIDAQATDLKSQIVNVLLQRKAALNQYLLQSDLSIARLHEKAIKIPELD